MPGAQAAEHHQEGGDGYHNPEAVKRWQRLDRPHSAPWAAQRFPEVTG
jgi:hypothetical protein